MNEIINTIMDNKTIEFIDYWRDAEICVTLSYVKKLGQFRLDVFFDHVIVRREFIKTVEELKNRIIHYQVLSMEYCIVPHVGVSNPKTAFKSTP